MTGRSATGHWPKLQLQWLAKAPMASWTAVTVQYESESHVKMEIKLDSTSSAAGGPQQTWYCPSFLAAATCSSPHSRCKLHSPSLPQGLHRSLHRPESSSPPIYCCS
jgi:hypothetical protein